MSKSDDTARYHAEVQRLRSIQGGGEADKPRRLSVTDAYERTAGLLELALSRTTKHPTEGVDLTRNAKGETQISVSGGTHEGETLEECAARVSAVYIDLRARFPLPSGFVGAEHEQPKAGDGGR